jgi:hypothetical protein
MKQYFKRNLKKARYSILQQGFSIIKSDSAKLFDRDGLC